MTADLSQARRLRAAGAPWKVGMLIYDLDVATPTRLIYERDGEFWGTDEEMDELYPFTPTYHDLTDAGTVALLLLGLEQELGTPIDSTTDPTPRGWRVFLHLHHEEPDIVGDDPTVTAARAAAVVAAWEALGG